MGGWMASAMAAFQPKRLASLTIGGWDVVNGMYTPAAAWGVPKITYEILSGIVRRDSPALLAWLRPQDEPGLAAAVDAMNDLTGLAEAVARRPAPVALWVGESDLYFPPCVRFASAYGFPLLALPGDHITMLDQHGGEAARMLSGFIEEVELTAASASAVGLPDSRHR
jgi:pimeloyl-ACP methyl ester carboxylesterase